MLFGHQNDDTSQMAQTTAAPQAAGVNPLAVDPQTGASLPAVPPTSHPEPAELDEPSVLNQPSTPDAAMGPTPAVPPLPFPPAPESDTTIPSANDSVSPTTPSEPAPVPAPVSEPTSAPEPTPTPAVSGDLLALKQQALEQLDPLVSQLDQTPEEKFRTTMMLIQSTDNPARLQDAYDAAQAIADDKVRAEALLDVINEINYFTQKGSN